MASREKTREMIRVMQAYVDGEDIEFCVNGVSEWSRLQCGCWNWETNNYRIKPKPREWWLIAWPDRMEVSNNEQGAVLAIQVICKPEGKIIHVREVLEGEDR